MWAVLKPCYRQLLHSELSPQSFTGLFTRFSSFQKIKLPGLIRPEDLCYGLLQSFLGKTSVCQQLHSEACGFFFPSQLFQQPSSLLILIGLSLVFFFFFLGMLARFLRVPATVLPRVTWQLHFHDYVKIKVKFSVEEKNENILELHQFICVTISIKKHFCFTLGIAWSQ